MRQWQDDPKVVSFYKRVEAGPMLLILDYDGTLAPFQIDPSTAVPYPELMDKIKALIATGNTTVIIVSGRSLVTLMPLLKLTPMPELWGLHGGERLTQDGVRHNVKPTKKQREGLRIARQAIDAGSQGGRWEDKGSSLALHWRGLPIAAQQSLAQMVDHHWPTIASSYQLEVLPFDGGREIRLEGLNKGRAILTIVADYPSLASTEGIVYIGDDTTDEEAFAALGQRGLKVLVNPTRNPNTNADIQLTSTRELTEFLDGWIVSLSNAKER